MLMWKGQGGGLKHKISSGGSTMLLKLPGGSLRLRGSRRLDREPSPVESLSSSIALKSSVADDNIGQRSAV